MTTTSYLSRFRYTRLFLAVSMLIMGTCGIVYEYLLGLMGNNLMGSSHQQIFVIIGIMLFAMGIGANLQQHLTEHLIDWFLRFELLLGLLGGFSALLTYIAFVYMVNYELVLYSLAFILGMLIGLEIPLLIRINSTYADSLRTNLGDILTMDYVGSLLGALLFTYVLLTRISLPNIGLIMGVFNVGIAAAGLWFFWPLVEKPRILLVALILGLPSLLVGMHYSNDWMMQLQQRTFEDPIVLNVTSKYQNIVLTQRDQRIRLYLNGHLQFDARDEHIYHEQLVHVPMAVAERRERVLILGGGDGLALREVLKYPDVQQVTLVDIDPKIVELAREHPILNRLNQQALHDARVLTQAAPVQAHEDTIQIERQSILSTAQLDDSRYRLAEVQVFTVDADNFVRDTHGLFDVVILDFPDPRSVELGKLYSLDFYHALRQHMTTNAVLSVQSTSPYRAKNVFLCIGETLRGVGFQALPYRDYLPSFGDWGWHLAWQGNLSIADMQARLQAVEAFEVNTQHLTPELMRTAFVFGKGRLDVPDGLKSNSKMQPVITVYYAQGFE